MSRDGSTHFGWADGAHRFRLGIGEIEELQEKTGCGPLFLLNRLVAGTWMVHDIRETLRLGLIGGGLEATKASRLIARYVDGAPLTQNVQPAIAVLTAAVIGAPDGERPGKAAAARTRRGRTTPPAEGSALPDSTEQEQS